MTFPTTTEAQPGQYATVAALAALSTADCLVDAGPATSLACGSCEDDEGCAAVATCHITYTDRTAVAAGFREGDRCAAHARVVVLHARDRASYVDVEVRQGAAA